MVILVVYVVGGVDLFFFVFIAFILFFFPGNAGEY